MGARNRYGVIAVSRGGLDLPFARNIGCERSDCLFEASDGRIWVTGAGQPCVFDGTRWLRLEHELESKFFAQLDDGNYYLGTSDGNVYVSEEPMPSAGPLKAWSDVTISRLRAVEILNDTFLWVGVKEGILLGTRPRWRERSLRADVKNLVGSMGFYTSTERWPIALRTDGVLIQFQPETERWSELVRLPFDDVTQPMIAAPREGICWIRSGSDVFAVDLDEARVIQRVALPDGFVIHDLACHPDGRLFVAGERGGFYLTEDRWVPSLGDQIIYSIEFSQKGLPRGYVK